MTGNMKAARALARADPPDGTQRTPQDSKSSRAQPVAMPDIASNWTGSRTPSETATERYLRGTIGFLLARPWFDPVATMALRRYFFPLSRLWAAAGVAGGDPERFFEAIPMSALFGSRDRVLRALTRYEQARATAHGVETEWQRVFFGEDSTASKDDIPIESRVAVEAARLEARHNLGLTRRHFRFLLSNDVPRVHYLRVTPDDVEDIYAPALKNLAPFVEPTDPIPEIETSRALPTASGTDFWLRFASPSDRLGDTVYARVLTPHGIKDPPTIIFGHGVCVEFDHWEGLIDEAHALVARGFRVIRPEAPFHGRRRLTGTYGGEPIISSFPLGPLDLFTGAAREWAVLADWARATSSGPLAFGGSSLGALTAQFVADRSRDWPQRLRPDALFLIAHCENLTAAVFDGVLVSMWGEPELLMSHGLQESKIRPYLDLLGPRMPLSLPAEKIVSVLGSRDQVTPFRSGRALVKHWRIPDNNLFILDRGHFTVPLTLARLSAPLDRFCRIMGVRPNAK